MKKKQKIFFSKIEDEEKMGKNVAFDIQRCFCVGVCLVIVNEVDDIIIVLRSFFPSTVC